MQQLRILPPHAYDCEQLDQRLDAIYDRLRYVSPDTTIRQTSLLGVAITLRSAIKGETNTTMLAGYTDMIASLEDMITEVLKA